MPNMIGSKHVHSLASIPSPLMQALVLGGADRRDRHGGAGLQACRDAMRHNNVLREMNIRSCFGTVCAAAAPAATDSEQCTSSLTLDCSNKGAAALASGVIPVANALTSLSAQCCEIGDKGMCDLIRAVGAHGTLVLGACGNKGTHSTKMARLIAAHFRRATVCPFYT